MKSDWIESILQYHFPTPKPLKACLGAGGVQNRSFVQTVYSDPLSPRGV